MSEPDNWAGSWASRQAKPRPSGETIADQWGRGRVRPVCKKPPAPQGPDEPDAASAKIRLASRFAGRLSAARPTRLKPVGALNRFQCGEAVDRLPGDAAAARSSISSHP